METIAKTSELDDLGIVLELEGGNLLIENAQDFSRVLELADSLRFSQGFYGRLYRDIIDFINAYGGIEKLPFPFVM